MTPATYDPYYRPMRVFVRRVIELAGAALYFAWCAAFTIVLIGWALTAAG